MSATLGAVVRAPVTGVLIVFEMTHEFGLVPALMIGALVSQTISRKMLKHSFYDALLKQDGSISSRCSRRGTFGAGSCCRHPPSQISSPPSCAAWLPSTSARC